jgi:hypothetical protein
MCNQERLLELKSENPRTPWFGFYSHCEDCQQGRMVAHGNMPEGMDLDLDILMAKYRSLPEDRSGSTTEEREDEEMSLETRICVRCRKEYPIDMYYRDKTEPGGRKKVCKGCCSEYSKQKGTHRKAERIVANENVTTNQPAKTPEIQAENQAMSGWFSRPEAGQAPADTSPACLVVDFTGYQELLDRIVAFAKEELRTPENQVLWWLRRHSIPAPEERRTQ